MAKCVLARSHFVWLASLVVDGWESRMWIRNCTLGAFVYWSSWGS